MAHAGSNGRVSGITEAGLVLGFLSLLGLFILSAAVSFGNVNRILANADKQQHTSTVLLATERTAAALSAAESAVRGFVITGDEDFAKQMELAIEDAGRRVHDLKSLTLDNPSQQERL